MAEPGTGPATGLRIGCAGLPPQTGRGRYFQHLPYLESPATFFDPPRPATLRKWRKDMPEGTGIGLQAWQLITHDLPPGGYPRMARDLPRDALRAGGSFRDSPTVADAAATMIEATAAVGAEAVVFRTPAEFAPSATNRDRMRRFFTEVAPPSAFGGARLAWEPLGLWEPETAIALASELGLVYACDPLASDPLGPGPELYASLPGGQAYFRITGLGRARHRIDESALEDLVDIAGAYGTAWVVFANVAMAADAVRFAELAGLAEPPDGAGE